MDFENLSRTELAAARVQCDKSLLYFTRFWYRVLRSQKFIVNWHHEEICRELRRVENYEIELLNINIPPRFSKTELAAVNFIARGIGMNPAGNYLYITASDELRAQTSVSIRDIVSHPYFKIMYGVELKKDQNAKNLWRTSKGGGLKTATIFGQVTGFGAGQMIYHNGDLIDYMREFEGCIVLDDINKTDDAEQENANSDKVSRVIFNTIFSRKNSKDTPIINIQQRSGMKDSTQQFLNHYGEDNPKAKFLVLPIVMNGKPLWEWKHDMAAIEELKNSPATKYVFQTQYMQEPVNKQGILLPLSDMKFTPLITDGLLARLAFADPADGGGDQLAVIFCSIRVNNGQFRFRIDDVIYTKAGIESTNEELNDKIEKWGIEQIFIESNGVGRAMMIHTKQKLRVETCQIIPYNQKINKEGKINSFYEFVRDYCEFDENYKSYDQYELFIEHIIGYSRENNNAHKKDAIDVVCSAAQILKVKYRELIYSVKSE